MAKSRFIERIYHFPGCPKARLGGGIILFILGKVLSKVAGLFLAAIAVMMIRKGIMKILLLS